WRSPWWQRADRGGISRAKRGAGVGGGRAREPKTAPAFFYENGFQPYGASWGAPFPPTQTCTPPPSPSPSAPLPYCVPGEVQLNPDGTVYLDPNGQPVPCPTAPPNDGGNGNGNGHGNGN